MVPINWKLIAERLSNAHRVELYFWDGLYAELFYNQETNMVERVGIFENVDLLDPYLNNIVVRSKKV